MSRARLPIVLARAVVVLVGLATAGCRDRREPAEPAPSYRGEIQALLQARCAECHGADKAEAGWRADSFLAAIGCVDEARPVTLPVEAAPVLVVLEREDHRDLLDAAQRERLRLWVEAGAPLGDGVHPSSFADPRSPESHGAFLRARRYRPLRSAEDTDACGRCHASAPAIAGFTPPLPADGAPSCTSCHSAGVFACGTCHGEGERAAPPRNRCFFPDDRPGAHAAHLNPSASRSEGLACSTCHPVPDTASFESTHGDGVVEVWLDFAQAGAAASFDAQTGRCAGTCHDRGGARPQPLWSDTGARCMDCHGSPPANHYQGACASCHAEANAEGTALSPARLHLNGRVDLGDGSGRCGSCHGSGDDAWPSSGAHRAHAAPSAARPVPCTTCHVVPVDTRAHPVGRGAAAVRFAGLALASASRPRYDADSQSCAGTYCHDGAGGTLTAPRWNQGAGAASCGACHAVPPPPPHSQASSCAGTGCHTGSTSPDLQLTPAGAAVHVDGTIDRGL